MALRDAAVRLSLQSGSFMGGLNEVTQKVQAFGKQVRTTLKTDVGEGLRSVNQGLFAIGGALKAPSSAGWKAVRQEVGGLAREAKGMVSAAAALGGGFSFGAAAHEAIELGDQYRNIAFAIEAGTGKATSWQTVQDDVQASAMRWSRSNAEVARSYSQLYQAVGDPEFAKVGMEEIAKAATAGAGSVEELTEIVGALNETFGVSKEQLPNALAAMIGAADKGGATIGELAGRLGTLGASAKFAGLEGADGMMKLIGMLNMADGNARKPLVTVGKLLEKFANIDQVKLLEKELRVKLTTAKGEIRTDIIERILQKTEGNKEKLTTAFKGDEGNVLAAFGASYRQTFAETEGTIKQKTQAATEAFRRALEDASKTANTAAKMTEEAEKRKQDVSRKLQAATNKLVDEFSKPEAAEALKKLAEVAPKVAQAMSQLLSFTLEHPVKAGAIAVTAKLGAAGAGAFAGSAMNAAARQMSNAFMAQVAARGAWGAIGTTLGGALGVSAAGIIGYEIGEKLAPLLLKGTFDREAKKDTDVVSGDLAAFEAVRSGDKGQQTTVLAQQRERLKQLEKGPSVVSKVFGQIANTVTLGEVKTAGERNDEQIAKTKSSIRDLEAALAKGSSGGDRFARSLERAADAADRLTRSHGGLGSHGLPKMPSNKPGYEGG